MPSGIYLRTEERRAKMSLAVSGSKNPMYGKHLTEETKIKLSLANRGQVPWIKGKHHTEKTKAQQSKAMIGKYRSEEYRANIRKARLGKYHSEETKLKISLTNSGENHPQWQGGISSEPYGVEFNDVLREQVRERDNHTCQICGIGESGYKLHIHHIDYNKENNNPANLITLCINCHPKTNHNREFWQNLGKFWDAKGARESNG